ncbi:hypothetical protein KPATCC21470_6013 [Kitasatospora purpeofusca]
MKWRRVRQVPVRRGRSGSPTAVALDRPKSRTRPVGVGALPGRPEACRHRPGRHVPAGKRSRPARERAWFGARKVLTKSLPGAPRGGTAGRGPRGPRGRRRPRGP